MKALLNSITIAYETHGPVTGTPIVFIHGFPFNHTMWNPQVEILKKKYFVVTYDIRGHGDSEVGDGQYSVEYFVDDLFALLDHLKITRVILCGLSMGGYIALRALERDSSRFRALILCDTRSEPDNNEGKIRRAAQASAIKREGMKSFSISFLEAVFYEQTAQHNPALVQEIGRMIANTSPIGAAGTLLALAARTDMTPFLFSVSIPTLILVGQHDHITPPSAAHAMKEKITHAELHIIAKAGHLSNLENAGEFNDRLTSFLKNIY